MSLARAHREAFLAAQSETAVAPVETGGQPEQAPIEGGRASLARDHIARTLAAAVAISAAATPALSPEAIPGTPEERGAAQINLRLQTDLRRLRDIASIERKIDAKREMLPEYAAWVEGLLAAGVGVEEDVLPTIMIWRIDTGDFAAAMPLVEHMLAHKLSLPARYDRSAPALIVEEIAEAALKLQQAGAAFDLPTLNRIDELTATADMHDQIRAKLKKAIGVEQMRPVDNEELEPLPRAAAAALALETLRRAVALNPRVGAKDRITRLEKLLAPPKKQPARTGA
ncbi:phage terminase small subunit [Sphingomonas sp.]|jgi:hypothetical protein|uniref:phage terminase small subunit n=1 Tax=Sphingomonas sp. TaxID=28214 RepID=UPI002ED98BF4